MKAIYLLAIVIAGFFVVLNVKLKDVNDARVSFEEVLTKDKFSIRVKNIEDEFVKSLDLNPSKPIYQFNKNKDFYDLYVYGKKNTVSYTMNTVNDYNIEFESKLDKFTLKFNHEGKLDSVIYEIYENQELNLEYEVLKFLIN